VHIEVIAFGVLDNGLGKITADRHTTLARTASRGLQVNNHGAIGTSIAEVEVKSVRKKLKDKAFARAVNRDDVINGAAEMGLDLDEHIAFCIEAMKARAASLGLGG